MIVTSGVCVCVCVCVLVHACLCVHMCVCVGGGGVRVSAPAFVCSFDTFVENCTKSHLQLHCYSYSTNIITVTRDTILTDYLLSGSDWYLEVASESHNHNG